MNVGCVEYAVKSVVGNAKGFNIHRFPKGSVFLVAITYITPTYLAMHMFNTIAGLSKMGYSVYILFHDNNLFSHEVFLNKLFYKSTNLEKETEKLTNEMMSILGYFDADINNIVLLRSSNVWQNLVKDKPAFFRFTTFAKNSNLGERKINSKYLNLGFLLDIFMMKEFENIVGSQLQKPDYIIASGEFSQRIYKDVIKSSQHEQSDYEVHNSQIMAFKSLPMLMVGDEMPNAYSSYDFIKHIVELSRLSFAQRKKIVDEFIKPTVKSLENKITINLNSFKVADATYSNEAVVEMLYYLLHSFNAGLEHEKDIKNAIYVMSRTDFLKLKEILASSSIMDVLLSCNGTMTSMEIAKNLRLQPSNVSKYLSKLRVMGLVNFNKKPSMTTQRIEIDLKSVK